MAKPAANARSYLLGFGMALWFTGIHPPSARAGVIHPTAAAPLHLAKTAKTSRLLPCFGKTPCSPLEIARHKPHELEADLLSPLQKTGPRLVVSSPSPAPSHNVLLDVRAQIALRSQGGRARGLPTMRYEPAFLLTPPIRGHFGAVHSTRVVT